MPRIYYHYTDTEGYKAIVENPVIGPNREEAVVLLSSNKALSGDAPLRRWLVCHRYSTVRRRSVPRLHAHRGMALTSRIFAKTEYFLEFRIHGNTKITECSRHKFLIPIGSNPRPILYQHGRVVSGVFPIRFPSSLTKPTAPRRVIFKKRESNTDWQKRKIDPPVKRNSDSLLQRVKRLLGF